MKYYMDVYGCQMNVHDSEIIEGILQSRGMKPADSSKTAEVILLVSCAVREHAETRVLGRAAQLGGMYRGREEGKPVIVLCGCVAQEHGDSLLERYRDLDLVVGPDCYHELPVLIEKARERSSIFRTSLTDFRSGDYTGAKPVRRQYPRSFVTIMRGCDNFCSYCIVPYVRGRERSRKPEEILKEVQKLSEEGYGEITLLGQNVNSYKSEEMGFAALLEEVSEAAGSSWVRFVTSHPKDLDEKIASVMSSRRNVCRQLHLPFQSGSSRILKRMNRGYTAEQYRDKIAMLREYMPEIVLSTDVIAGFPGEAEEDFQKTVEMLQEVEFDYAFLFKYSERTGTAACGFEGRIAEEERLSRLNTLQDLQRKITVKRSRQLRGELKKVLVTGPAKRKGQQACRSRGNRMVILEGTDYPAGDFVNVRITEADGWTHFAEPFCAEAEE